MTNLRFPVCLVLLSAVCALNVFSGCGSDDAEILAGDPDAGDGSTSNHPNGDGSPGPGETDGSFVDAIVDGGRSEDANTQCTVVGNACTKSNACCSANCDAVSGKCAAPANGCGLPGAVCATGVDCCTGSCTSGTCSSLQCVADNGSCGTNSDCCSQTCTPNGTGGGVCKPLGTKPTSGNPCSVNGDCASGFCNNGVCATPSPICIVTGDICASDTQCCGGQCKIASGATVGTCANVTALGNTVGGPCLPAGELCSPNGTCTGAACCSRSCAPSPTSGLGVCQPESGCHMIGDLCRTTTDCCGVKNLPGSIKGGDGPSTDVQCEKQAGQTFGVCNYQTTVCSPAGALCKPGNATTGGAMSCSTKADCCAGNDNQHPTCQIDNNGIPRCTIEGELNCANGKPPAGTQCASSADCCGDACVKNTDPGTSATKPFVCGTTACQGNGTTCTSNADCCTGLPCAIPTGSSFGICGGTVLDDGGVSDAAPPGSDGGVVQPPTDSGTGTTCAIYGQVCSDSVPCCSAVPCTRNSTTGLSTCHYP